MTSRMARRRYCRADDRKAVVARLTALSTRTGGTHVARLDEPWVVDNEPSERFRIYTRANVGEVFPDPVTPLTWTIGGARYAEAGWRDALARFGAATHEEFNPDVLEVMGVFGGYCYLNVS